MRDAGYDLANQVGWMCTHVSPGAVAYTFSLCVHCRMCVDVLLKQLPMCICMFAWYLPLHFCPCNTNSHHDAYILSCIYGIWHMSSDILRRSGRVIHACGDAVTRARWPSLALCCGARMPCMPCASWLSMARGRQGGDPFKALTVASQLQWAYVGGHSREHACAHTCASITPVAAVSFKVCAQRTN